MSSKDFWENYTFELLEQYNSLQVTPTLSTIERSYTQHITGDLLHIFCNFGINTFVLEKFCDSITGLDFSEPAINYALRYKELIKSNAKFIREDFLTFNPEYNFDTIYASYGILDWVEDLDKFFEQVKTNLKPGGKFILIEFTYDFFEAFLRKSGIRISDSEVLISTNKSINESKSLLGGEKRGSIFTKVYLHPLVEILNSLANSKFYVEHFNSFDYINFRMTDEDIVLGPKKFRHPDLFDESNMCFGLVALLNDN